METNDTLKKHQHLMLDMLFEVDRICRKHSISYMLFSGTALGAVRHHGFIPRDDDLDVIMLRPDYERFLQTASGEIDPNEYFLQKEFSEHWPMFFSKLRKNGTACIERYIPKDTRTHQGIYIDIFPCDNLSNIWPERKLQFLASKVVIAKALDCRGYLTDSKWKKLFMALCKRIPDDMLIRFVKLEKGNDSRMVHCFFGASSKYRKSVFPRQWFQDTVLLPFETGDFPVSAHYDKMLTVLYGNYMEPTPADERGRKIHAEIVDLDHSYETYIGVQEKMNFSEFTRSIR